MPAGRRSNGPTAPCCAGPWRPRASRSSPTSGGTSTTGTGGRTLSWTSRSTPSAMGSMWRRVRRLPLSGLLALSLPAATYAQTGPYCPPYPSSPLFRPRLRQVPANPTNWIARIEGALSGDEVLLADGTYDLGQYAVQITVPITVRGASGNRDAVVIRGPGYGTPAEGLMIHAANVTVADLTITGMRFHAISIKGESG